MERLQVNMIIKDTLMGKEEAFCELYQLSAPKIKRQMRRSRVAHADVEDIIQETMLRVLERLPQLRNHDCYEIWLYRIAKSVFLNQLNKKKMYTLYENIDWVQEERVYMNPHGCIKKLAIIEEINTHLCRLKPSDQKVIILRYLAEMSEEEIASEIKISKVAVRSRIYRAKMRMQRRSKKKKSELFL